ncbi:uncharacterized protein LOC134546246 [Bacillus rossius redtenbacheri]|uniref:uncharacterized protein LOC134546246 n=1 Tax=Bacillus rossius redtenbacheri TaxID=93214 RepID=UPI002FDEF758
MARRVRGKISFQTDWKVEFPWVEDIKDDRHSARCAVCGTTFSITSMGRTALTSHASGNKHKKNVSSVDKTAPIQIWATTSAPETSKASEPSPLPSSSVIQPSSAAVIPGASMNLPAEDSLIPKSASTTRCLDNFLLKDDVTRAEALWCLETVMNHNSLRSAASSVNMFKRMFPNDRVANNMKLQKDKISYVIVYGLAPYFYDKLKSVWKECEHFVLGFDESVNKIAQKQQMDLSVRIWDSNVNKVMCRYVTSIFLNHATAEDLLQAMKTGLEGFDMMKIIQLSMDGPNVNFKVLRLLQQDSRSDPESPQLLDIGSCGLHTVHNSFKTGIKKSGWEIIEFLRALYNLFKEAPSRRGDYTEASNSHVFPLRVCSIRWIENGKVARRAMEILPLVEKYVNIVKTTAKEPSCNSFSVVCKALQDKLLQAKIAFFEALASDVEPFLVEFQSDSPMAPFLFDSLTFIVMTAMKRIVKTEIIEKTPLHKIDVFKQNADKTFVNLKDVKHVELGYSTRAALRKCKNASEKDILIFRKECRNVLQFFVSNLLLKSPLKYSLTKALTFLNPYHISSKDSCVKQLTTALDHLLTANLLPASTVERADREYRFLCSQSNVIEEMKTYSKSETRLDTFWVQLIEGKKEYENLFKVVKLLLILSHGSANIERGFSVNKEILVENLKEPSLIAQRRIFDFVSNEPGGLMKLDIPKAMIHAVRNAYSMYSEALAEQQCANKKIFKLAEERKRAATEIKQLEAKKLMLLEDVQRAVSAIDEKVKDLKK